MLEVHAILQRQRCNENITKKTGTLSDAYLKKLPLLDVFLRLSKTRRLQYRIKPLLWFILKTDDFFSGRK